MKIVQSRRDRNDHQVFIGIEWRVGRSHPWTSCTTTWQSNNQEGVASFFLTYILLLAVAFIFFVYPVIIMPAFFGGTTQTRLLICFMLHPVVLEASHRPTMPHRGPHFGHTVGNGWFKGIAHWLRVLLRSFSVGTRYPLPLPVVVDPLVSVCLFARRTAKDVVSCVFRVSRIRRAFLGDVD